MMDQSYLISLSSKHANLDKRIADETVRPRPDTFLLASLKKQKLRLKEVMHTH